MATANERLRQGIVEHQIGLIRVGNNLRRRVLSHLKRTEANVRREIADRALRIASGDDTPVFLTDDVRQRLSRLESAIQAARNPAFSAILSDMRSELTEIAVAEPEFLTNLIRQVSPVDLPIKLPDANELSRIVTSRPFQGRLLREWTRNIDRTERLRIMNEIRIGLTQGQNASEITRRIVGTARLAGADGVTNLTRAHVQTLVRTAINHIGSAARREFAIANRRLFKREQWVAVLDSRTCFVAGTIVATPSGGIPIEEIERGDMVIGGTGRQRRVMATTSTGKESLVDVRLSNGYILRCTDDHLFHRPDGTWTEAKDLAVNDALARKQQGPSVQEMSLAMQLNCYGVQHANERWRLPPLRSIVPIPQAEACLLLKGLLLGGEKGWVIQGQGASCSAQDPMHTMWDHRQENASDRSRRQAMQEPVLLKLLLSPMGGRTKAILSKLRATLPARFSALKKILFAGVSGKGEETCADKLQKLRVPVHCGEANAQRDSHPDSCSDECCDMLKTLPPRMDFEQSGKKRQDQRCILWFEPPKLEGRPKVERFTWARVAGYQEKGFEEGWLSLRGLWKNGRAGVVGFSQIFGRRSHRAVSQFYRLIKGEQAEQPRSSMQVLSYESGGKKDQRSDDIRVVAVSPTGTKETVYDIEVECDHSFIVGGVVVHNSNICLAGNGTIFEVGKGPFPPYHMNCRSIRAPFLDPTEAVRHRIPADQRRALLRRFGEENDLGRITQRRQLNRTNKRSFDAFLNRWVREQVGAQPAVMTTADFLGGLEEDQLEDVLGVTKARLVKRGGLSIGRLVDREGEPLSLAALAIKEKRAFTRSGLFFQDFQGG